MKTQTPNLRTTTPPASNHLTAEGKMKAPTGMPELSLQDVFSDSVNLIGSHQKTIRLFESEQEKGAQLLKEKGEKKPKIQIRRKEKTQNDRIRIDQYAVNEKDYSLKNKKCLSSNIFQRMNIKVKAINNL